MPTRNGRRTYGSHLAAELAGITYRQLDHWTRTGVIPVQTGGSGSRRVWSLDEVVLMALVGEVSSSAGPASLGHIRGSLGWLLEQIEDGAEVVAWMGSHWSRVDGDAEGFVDHVVEFGLSSVAVFNLSALRDRVGKRGRSVSGRLGLAAS